MTLYSTFSIDYELLKIGNFIVCWGVALVINYIFTLRLIDTITFTLLHNIYFSSVYICYDLLLFLYQYITLVTLFNLVEIPK